MAIQNIFAHQQFHGEAELRSATIERLAVDPAGVDLWEGRIWVNTADGRVKWYDGTDIKSIAHLSDLNNGSLYLGNLDLAIDGLPTGSGISAGDFYYVTVGGPVPGRDALPGDLLFILADSPSGINGEYLIIRSQQDANHYINVFDNEELLAGANSFSLGVLFPVFARILSVSVTDNDTGKEITSGLDIAYNEASNELIICTLIGIDDVNIRLIYE